MKHISTLSLFLFFSVALFSQNAMFVCFEKCSQYETLKDRISQNPNVNVVFEDENFEMELEVNDFNFRYDFNEGHLYKVTMEKQYDKVKVAGEALKGCLKFFKRIKAEKVADFSHGNTKSYVFILNDKVYKLEVSNEKFNDVTMMLSSTYVKNIPIYDLDQYSDMAVAALSQVD